jgi:predicted transcriptional regulator
MKLKDYLYENSEGIREFSLRAGIDRMTISKILRGTKPAIKTIGKIIKATGGKVTEKDLIE